MADEAADLRRRAADARQVSAAAAAAARQAGPLADYLPRIAAAVDELVGGTATGQDRAMLGLLDRARREQRSAAEQCQSASRAAERLADRLEAEARAAEEREAAEERARKARR